MKDLLRATVLLTLALLLASSPSADAPARAQDSGPRASASPRRVVLFIGDGMGVSQVTLGRLAAERLHRPYAFDRFATIGLASTRSLDNAVTDSAAAATALSSGFKTRNHEVGMDEAGRARRTLLEIAHDAGFATGLVTTTRITHATPAGFAAHVLDRDSEEEIARQYVARASVNVLLGGGLVHFPEARLAALREKGYSVLTEASALRGWCPPPSTAPSADGRSPPPTTPAPAPTADGRGGEARQGLLFGAFAKDHLPYEIDRDASRVPSLREMTATALELLDRTGRPWFCMVEGGRIDHACHVHDAAALIPEQLAFADAIGAALERVERGGDLLVLVTADHATGALAISERLDLDGLLAARTSVEQLVLSNEDKDLTETPEVFKKVVETAYGFVPTDAELAVARQGKGAYRRQTPIGHVVSRRRGVGFYALDFQQDEQPSTHGHDGALVPVFAAGPGASSFAGLYENTRIPVEIARLLGLPQPGRPERPWR